MRLRKLVVLTVPLLVSVQAGTSAQGDAASARPPLAASSQRQFLDRYCANCHNDRLKTGGLSLDHVDLSRPEAQSETRSTSRPVTTTAGRLPIAAMRSWRSI